MLKIKINDTEVFNEETNEFIQVKGTELVLEHSLVSISKWESKFHKPFLEKNNKTTSEIIEYIKCMTITQNVNPNVYYGLNEQNFKDIDKYISDPMTATVIKRKNTSKRSSEYFTNELIYYYMTVYNIPHEFEKWHINRLLTLIEICSIKSEPGKKMNKKQIYSQNRSLNAARRRAMHSRG